MKTHIKPSNENLHENLMNLRLTMQVEWDGVPVRRSSRLNRDTTPPLPPAMPPVDEDEVPCSARIRASGSRSTPVWIETIPLTDTEAIFNPNFLASQEDSVYSHYSSDDYVLDEEEPDRDTESIKEGGLEKLLWPPEVLLQAQN